MKKIKFETVKGWNSYKYLEFNNSKSNTLILKIIGTNKIRIIFKVKNIFEKKLTKDKWNIQEVEIINLKNNEKLIFIDDKLTKRLKIKGE